MILLVVAITIQDVSPPPRTRPVPEERFIYACHDQQTQVTGHGDALILSKNFNEDGSVASFSVEWRDDARRITSSDVSPGSGFGGIRWSAADGNGNGTAPLDWSRGVLRFTWSTTLGAHTRDSRKRIWRQIFLDRGSSLRVAERKGERYLLANGFAYATVPLTITTSGLAIPLDDLFAWGSGLNSLTVHEVLLRPEKHASGGGTPFELPRIFATYRLDVDAVRKAVESIRAATNRWEASVTEFKAKCERQRDPAEENIVVTNAH